MGVGSYNWSEIMDMHVICRNDYPLFVCPIGTSREEAEHVAKVKQAEGNKRMEQGQHVLCMHVQTAALLTREQIEQITKDN